MNRDRRQIKPPVPNRSAVGRAEFACVHGPVGRQRGGRDSPIRIYRRSRAFSLSIEAPPKLHAPSNSFAQILAKLNLCEKECFQRRPDQVRAGVHIAFEKLFHSRQLTP